MPTIRFLNYIIYFSADVNFNLKLETLIFLKYIISIYTKP